MNSPFDQLNLDPKLACDFLALFARYEFALKAAKPANGGEAKAGWDEYAKGIDKAFSQLKNAELTAAVDYLLSRPPKKQVFRAGKLEWEETGHDNNVPRAQQVLVMVRRVRNNLFHGGKFLPAEAGDDPGRDQLLVEHSLVVLRACLPLDQEVHAAFSA